MKPQSSITKNLKYRKICTRWVPRILTKEMKEKRLNACKELLQRYEIEGEGFIDRIVTGVNHRFTITFLTLKDQVQNGITESTLGYFLGQ
ncbi:hypothetical protein LAZ67_3003982 [Cordylochernes scorpioides]|uniref:Uncharacterized protein n=1 Tax=Cordylochernes scorpioides TaxID=51811 RepID=A0ABY6K9H9_9ARAC|nr:hypothetical protein LAZ67_3003982 [Cordylochernes scorpioides]